MQLIKKLIGSTITCLREEGLKETLYVIYYYLVRRVRIWKVRQTDYLDVKIENNEKSYLTKKGLPNVHIVTAIPYYDVGGGQRAAQLAKTFNQMGYRVKFFYTQHSYDKKMGQVVIPTEAHTEINDESIAYLKKNVDKGDLFVFESPFAQFEPLLDIALENGCKIIYENIDNWETSLGSTFFDERVLKKFLDSADVLTGTAKPLVKQMEEYIKRFELGEKKVLYLANAVDDALFCGLQKLEKPEDLVKGEQTLLYYGTLWGEWFDWDILLGLAKKHPEYAINLIGNAEGMQKRINDCPANVHFLGQKAQKELPAYLQYVDYTMIPFKRGEIGDYVSPLKIFEYIAMYTRVLCTTLPDVTGYPNVYFGDTAEEWESIIQEKPEIDREAADAFVDQNTWFNRVTSMLQNTVGQKASVLKDKLSIIILNYNNKNVVFKCLNSLLAYQDFYGYEIVVVDNGSTDGSYELLCEKYQKEQVEIYRNSKNGCSSGRNLGVSKTNREYIMFLDSDQWVTNTQWLKPYEDVMSAHPDFGAIGWAAGFFNLSGRTFRIVDDFIYRYMPPQMLCRNDIGYLGSGGMLLRRETFEAIEGFDTYYDPTCCEDTDLSLKIRDYGKELYYCPYLGVIHLPHQTTNVGSDQYNQLHQEKKTYFVEKWKKKNPDLLKYVKV